MRPICREFARELPRPGSEIHAHFAGFRESFATPGLCDSLVAKRESRQGGQMSVPSEKIAAALERAEQRVETQIHELEALRRRIAAYRADNAAALAGRADFAAPDPRAQNAA
jgi:hypothetical protein